MKQEEIGIEEFPYIIGGRKQDGNYVLEKAPLRLIMMVGVLVNDSARRVGHLQDPASGPSLRNVWQLFRHS